jgi:hypothetical protein
MNILHTTLITLRDCRPYLLQETTLLQTIRITVKPPPSMAEFQAALQQLGDKQAILSIKDGVTGENKWWITERGLALLQEAGI